MSFSEELLLAVVVAGVALVGTLLGSLMSGQQASRSLRDGHVSRVIAKRHELYQKCVEVFDANLHAMMGERPAPSATVEVTASVDLQMQIFADHNVLIAGDGYRDRIREAAQSWLTLNPAAKRDLALRAFAARTDLIAAMRADLAVDSLSYGSAWVRAWRYRRLRKAQQEVLAQLREDLPVDAFDDRQPRPAAGGSAGSDAVQTP